MLKILRKNTKFILWLLISSFVLWGVGSAVFSRGGGPTYAGIMFGKKISLDEFGKAWTESRIQAMLMYGEDFFNMAQSLDLDRETWNRLILLREARNRRIKATDQEVVQVISGMPMFIRGDRFDQGTYDRIVKEYFRVVPREFENTIRGTLLITKLQQSILTEVTLTPEEIKEEYVRANEKAKADYILFAPADYHDRVSVSESEIENYYTGHKEDFKKEDKKKVGPPRTALALGTSAHSRKRKS